MQPDSRQPVLTVKLAQVYCSVMRVLGEATQTSTPATFPFPLLLLYSDGHHRPWEPMTQQLA